MAKGFGIHPEFDVLGEIDEAEESNSSCGPGGEKMSLQPTQDFTIPELTMQVAHAAFPKGNDYMRLREELGTISRDTPFAALSPRRGQPAEAPWRLALVNLMQFAERLTERQAADAVRSRINLKFVLGLELTDTGFHYSVLCEFRCRLLECGAEALLFEQLLTLFKARGLLKERGKQRTDSTHIIAAVRKLSRVELVWRHFRLTGKGTWSPAPWAN